jgi:hypothetical protein
VTDEHAEFRAQVAAARLQDPRPTFENLSAATSVPVEDLEHYALVKFVSAGSEALLALGPGPLDALVAARQEERWDDVAGIIDWLAAGR